MSNLWRELRTGEIANWPSADRCLFISSVVFLLYLYAALLVAYLAYSANRPSFIAPGGLSLLETVSQVTVAAWAVLVLTSFVLRRRAAESDWFVHLPIQLYALNSAFFSYMMGPLTTPFFPFAFLGGMLVAIPLFGYGPTLGGAASMVFLVLGASIAEQLHLLPYAPLLQSWPMDDGQLSTVWLVGLGSFELVALLLSLILAILLIDQLRQRERALLEQGDHLREAAADLEALGSTLTARNEQLRQQAEQLEMARDVAQASDLAKSRFLSRVSHETRTPLSGILGFAELLKGRHFGDLTERQAMYVQHIQESGQHLFELINDLLDVTKLETGAVDLNIERVSPAELVLEVVENLEPARLQKELEIINDVGDEAPALEVDRRRFRQILYNLLSNAMKFTPRCGSVGVRWRPESSGWLCIEIWDDGIGIARHELQAIFEEFHQVDRERDEALGGSGIGLSLASRLAELHGGRIRVESEPGRGSTFGVILPRAQEEAAASRAAGVSNDESSISEQPRRNVRVLVAEDNAANAAVVRGLLEIRGIEPILVSNGPDAVETVLEQLPMLVLMDIQMPGFDGFEALRRIRADERSAEIPVLAMTAGAGERDLSRYLDAGFDALIPKPIDSSQLDDELERFLPDSSRA